jgi:hypothetical protein
MPDSVYIPCPKCGMRVEEVSDVRGDEGGGAFYPEEAPLVVIQDLNNWPLKCPSCAHSFRLRVLLTDYPVTPGDAWVIRNRRDE